jgi:para-aminobenzoate synthetase component 1
VARKLAHLPHLLFLDSADRHPERGRYSYVMAKPAYWYDGKYGYGNLGYTPPGPQDFLGQLARRPTGARVAAIPDLPPFQGGLAGVFGYGLGRQLERLPEPRFDEFALPDIAAGEYNWVVSFDHLARRAWIVACDPRPSRLGAYQRRAERELQWIKSIITSDTYPESRRILHGEPSELLRQHPLPGHPGVTSNFTPAGYRDAVRRAVEYIHAGDCFQVNLSQRLLAPLTEHPLELYGRLRQTNPAPFACYFDAGVFQIVSASPEQFLKVHNGEVVTRPIKGTRPRGRTPTEDAANVNDLVTSAKDRAENVMIVDLMRNDLGRVCEYGSVTVPRVCEVETFRDVHHLVSEVRGKLRPGMTPFDLLRAAFPGGSVTGAPKVRAMEVIAELEPTARGPYCGSVGFIGFDGSMDSNILIRTFTAGRGWLQFPVGGGIVADSDPAREYEETLHKAAGLLRALAK